MQNSDNAMALFSKRVESGGEDMLNIYLGEITEATQKEFINRCTESIQI